ncbi:hypothetical protein MMC12_003762 [Toensbergia leucococca]|nr:hypothetical protein [Toensbergia leucococca]
MSLPISLLQLLSNTLILHQTCPYIAAPDLLSLAATSKSFRDLIYGAPGVFRYLDLSVFKATVSYDLRPFDVAGNLWRNGRIDETITDDQFWSSPLRRIFSALRVVNVLQHVHTLVLDCLSVPAELVRDIICEEVYSVRLLSIRDVKNLNERKLMQVLRYVVRPSRPEGTPKLKGLYFFSPADPPPESCAPSKPKTLQSTEGVTISFGAQLGMQWNQRSRHALSDALTIASDGWYKTSGKMISRPHLPEWADVLRACEGLIAFDAVLCRGPRHDPSTKSSSEPYIPPNVASFALGPQGCEVCHTSPEGPDSTKTSPAEHFPLQAPPPLHTSSVQAARRLFNSGSDSLEFIARCDLCLANRYCERCHSWWCESCYRSESRTSTFTEMQKRETMERLNQGHGVEDSGTNPSIKVYLGLCIDGCLVEEMGCSGAGSMWG